MKNYQITLKWNRIWGNYMRDEEKNLQNIIPLIICTLDRVTNEQYYIIGITI